MVLSILNPLVPQWKQWKFSSVYEINGNNLYWSIENSGEILNKFKSRGFPASGLSTNDFSTLHTTLPHNLIKEKLT